MNETDQTVLDALLDSWQRSNQISLNLLHSLSPAEREARAMEGSPTVAELYAHMHMVRLFWLRQTAPETAEGLALLSTGSGESEVAERDPARITEGLNASAKAVREAVQHAVQTGQALKGPHASYDHPVLLLQHLLWHEGYHVGQIKLALKAAGRVLTDEEEERTIWSLWRTETW